MESKMKSLLILSLILVNCTHANSQVVNLRANRIIAESNNTLDSDVSAAQARLIAVGGLGAANANTNTVITRLVSTGGVNGAGKIIVDKTGSESYRKFQINVNNTDLFQLDTNGSVRFRNWVVSPDLTSLTTGAIISNNVEGVVDIQAIASDVTTAIHLLPSNVPETTATISELMLGRTLDQAFGGNYYRFSWSNIGSSAGNVSGLFIEAGGTQATGALMTNPFVFSIGIENPAATFTSYEPMRFMDDADTGNVAFGVGATSGRAVIQLPMLSIGSAGTRDSHSIIIQGKSNNGSDHNVDWKQFTDVTSNAGASSYVFQNRIDAVAFATKLEIKSDATLIVGGGTTDASITPGGLIVGGSSSVGDVGIVRTGTNSNMLRFGCASTPECSIASAITGAGTYSPLTLYTNNILRWTLPVDGGLMGPELGTDPAAPAANNGIIFFKDNGAGKTQFVVRFPTGATQVIATEP